MNGWIYLLTTYKLLFTHQMIFYNLYKMELQHLLTFYNKYKLELPVKQYVKNRFTKFEAIVCLPL
jgi:hypothetical protein